MFIVPKQFWETPEPEDINKITPDFVNWGIHFSINYFKSMKYGDISLKCVLEYQHSDSILTYDYAASNLYDKTNNIFFLAFEKEIGKSLNIMPYISIVVGIDPFNRNNVYYGGIAGITFFFRTK